jgi:hypothetical protein
MESAFFDSTLDWNLMLESRPPDAEIYIIPVKDWLRDSTITNNHMKLKKYQIVEKKTPRHIAIDTGTYVVVFRMGGFYGLQREAIVDVATDKKAKVLVFFVEYPGTVAGTEIVKFASYPPGAWVYLVPLYEWERDTTLEFADKRKLRKYLVPEGLTPVQTKAEEQVYMVLFDYNGKREVRKVDIIKGESITVKVYFEPQRHYIYETTEGLFPAKNLYIGTEPQGADVFLLPLEEWEKDTTIITDSLKLQKYLVPEGKTPVSTIAYHTKYIVVFVLNGARETQLIHVTEGKVYRIKEIFR